MIDYLKGKVLRKNDKGAVVDVSGVGFFIYLTKDTIDKIEIGREYNFFTHLSVKEDAFELYGFKDERERDIFHILISVQNIGEKTAMNIISSLGYDKIIEALENGEHSYFLRVKGIGEKTAKRIVLELKGKLSFSKELPEDAILGLVKLGFTRREAEESVKNVLMKKKDLTTEEIIKEVLSQ
jgi:Holliday junction DNA helicase RuvA|uniref:Holliday junction branch migration complex subunit RuvA n=1 Tax=candidate division WOR-3 bacterium TaxID=2052148 RepID=A0A7C4YFD6_UNCW3